MRLTNSIKALIILLIIVLTGAVGTMFFIMPLVNELGSVEREIQSKTSDINAAKETLTQNSQLRVLYEEALAVAVEAQKIFYPEMTKIETIDEINKLLESGGFKTESGITVSGITTASLSITLSKQDSTINYEIRQHSFLNDNVNTEVTQPKHENSLTRTEVFKAIEAEQFSGLEKEEMLTFLRNTLAMESIELGRIKANFSLDLTYKEYTDFLNLIDGMEKAVSITTARFRGDNVIHEAKETYNFEMYLYVIKPVDKL